MFSLLYGKTAAALFAKAAELQHEVGRVSFPSARDGLGASPGMFLQCHPCPLTMREPGCAQARCHQIGGKDCPGLTGE